MIVALLVTSSLSLLTFAVIGWSWFRSQRCLRGRYRSTVIVTLKTGAAFRGALFDSDPKGLVLRNVEALGQAKGPVPVDGEVLIQFAEVEFMQRP